MDLNDLTKKAQTFLDDPKVKKALKSEKAEDVSDKLLDSVTDVAQKATGSKFDKQINDARDAADKHVGNK
jgi:hypothetical protein